MVKMSKNSAMGALFEPIKTMLFGNQCCGRLCCARPRCTSIKLLSIDSIDITLKILEATMNKSKPLNPFVATLYLRIKCA